MAAQFFVGRDDGANFGPFESKVEALKWGVHQCTDEEVLSQYREEALQIEADHADEGFSEVYEARAIDLFDSVDWCLFSIEVWGMGSGDAATTILDPDDLHSPNDTMI